MYRCIALQHCTPLISLQTATSVKSTQQNDAYHVRGALISAIDDYLKLKSGEFRSEVIAALERDIETEEGSVVVPLREDSFKVENSQIADDQPSIDINAVYQNAYEHFGSSLAAR